MNEFRMKVLGRTIEHLGTQMYKHRAPSLAELVANAWDAGAAWVQIKVPQKDQPGSFKNKIEILDSGEGMDETQIQTQFLVVGRNRRKDSGGKTQNNRKVMGRKGIGKLAGFGLAEKIKITTWTESSTDAITFEMALQELKRDAGEIGDTKFPWKKTAKESNWPKSGTQILLTELRHASDIDLDSLHETLSRRFSRTTQGEMKIKINGDELRRPQFETNYVFPEKKDYEEATLPSGKKVKYRYEFSSTPLKSKEMQGFAIYAHERTAQAPPFFFDVESTASGQHSTRYISGEIVADFIDDGSDDESDIISTDRQELDWERTELEELKDWGDKLTRKLMRDCTEEMGKKLEDWILKEEEFKSRIKNLDAPAQKEISKFLKILGKNASSNDDRTKNLANSLIRAYEFRNFHDVIDDIESASNDPDRLEDVLGKLFDWKVLESRAIHEIVLGRLSIIDKLERMIILNAPETASKKTSDNLHDLLADNPWIINPEWQVFVEERSLGKLLREMAEKDCPEDMAQKRIDFLALQKSDDLLIIVELKRPNHPVELEELQRLVSYQHTLGNAHSNCKRVLIYGGRRNINDTIWKSLTTGTDSEVMTWAEMFKRAKSFYEHYRTILELDPADPKFEAKEWEVLRTREILESGTSHRDTEARKKGVGNSDA